VKINPNIKANQSSEIAIVVLFQGNSHCSGSWQWHPKTKTSRWSESFKTKELAVENAKAHGYCIIKDELGNTLVNKNLKKQ
jgi:hypothetical protein